MLAQCYQRVVRADFLEISRAPGLPQLLKLSTESAFDRTRSWAAQNRTGRGVGWMEAARLLWPHTLVGIVVFTAFAMAGGRTMLWAIPFAGGLPMAIPLCVLTADAGFGRWMRRAGIAAIPEEIG